MEYLALSEKENVTSLIYSKEMVLDATLSLPIFLLLVQRERYF